MRKLLLLIVFFYALTFLKAQVPIVITVAGNNTMGNTGDGGPAINASVDRVGGIVLDAMGNLYISTWTKIRKVNPIGIISTFAGTGTNGFAGDGGFAINAKFNGPNGLCFDPSGNLLVADGGNNRIRKIDPAGIITTIAGNGISGYSGDGGPAVNAQLSTPAGIKTDGAGNIYFLDWGNNCLRKIDPSGIITTIAGTGSPTFSGDGGLATSAGMDPYGLEIDAIGNIYIGTGNFRVRKINTSGVISTYAGNGTLGYSGDGGPALNAQFRTPSTVAFDTNGNLFIGDGNSYVVRKVGLCLPPLPEICMVQVDSLSENNIIYWDKSLYTLADTFYIYRDTANDNYALIGKVPYATLSMFTDTVRSLYAANGDPNASSWRYKISYAGPCGASRVVSQMSPWHQTLFMINSGSSFVWTHYQIEGKPLPVSGLQNYLFKRDNNSTGNYLTIQALSASSTMYTDVQYFSYVATANWRVETNWTTVCTPTMRYGNDEIFGAIVKSRSNVRNNRMIGVNEINQNNRLLIYPNPANNELTISSTQTIKSLQVMSVTGEVILVFKPNSNKTQINISSLSDGIYVLRVQDAKDVISHTKIVKQ